VEGVDGVAVRGREGEVDVLGRRALEQREAGTLPPDLRAPGEVAHLVADVRADRLVEPCRPGQRANPQPEVVDHARVAAGRIVDGLDAVAGGVEDESPVVARPVPGARAGRAVARVAGSGQGIPPAVDALACVGREADVEAARRRPVGGGSSDREVVPLP
jgi:hypothetical protein